MVLSSTTKTSSISSITNQPQGGGNNKPGLPPQVGRSSWSSIAYGTGSIPDGSCCKLSSLVRMNFTRTTRPVGTVIRVPRLTPNFG
jgi:hypothetical protein